MKVTLDISICPTSMERDGDILDESSLLQRIRDIAANEWGADVRFQTLQVGHRQGDEWARSWVDGKRDDFVRVALW